MKQLLFSAPRLRISAIFVSIVLLAGVVFALPKNAMANETVSIGVAPAIIEVAAQPGDSIVRELSITNQTGFSLPLTIDVQSLIDVEEPINPQLKKQYDGATWVSSNPESFIMAEGETKKIPVTIDIPPNASPGGHYAQISIRGLTLQSDDSSAGTASIVVPEITVSVFMTVAGFINERLSVKQENIFSLFVHPGQERTVEFTVENRGNVHSLIVPTLVLQREGEDDRRFSLTPKVVLPNTTKQFQETWQVPADAGMYTAKIEFTYGNDSMVAASSPERVAVVPGVGKLVLLTVVVFAGRYLFEKRRNIKAAYAALVTKA